MIRPLTSFTLGFTTAAILFLLVLVFTSVSSTFGITGNVIVNPDVSNPNHLEETAIQVYSDKIILDIPNASIANYNPTGSMRPTLNGQANGIRIKPSNPTQVSLGDIITFRQEKVLVVHRIIDVKRDQEGTYYVTKGDNNPLPDDKKVRFQDIEYVTVGVIW